MNILFTCAGRRNYLLEYFKSTLNSKGKIFAADMQISAPAMAAADVPLVVPAVYASGYAELILSLCRQNKIDALFSLNDLELPVLAPYRKEFEQIGVKLVISSDHVIDICFDKWKTFEFATELAINVPQTYLTLSAAKEQIKKDNLQFPVVVKPRWGSASIGIEFPETFNELDLAYQLLEIRLERTILSEISKTDPSKAILIQQKIHGKEYGLDILNDFSGKTVAVYVKEKLAMRAGETDKAVLRDIPELVELGFRIGNSLQHIGNLDCDLFEFNGKYYLLEMNPRFGGGYPFSQMAGADYPAAICAWIEGKPFDINGFKKLFDQPFAKCDTLLPTLK